MYAAGMKGGRRMIIGHIAEIERYFGISERLDRALLFLQKTDFSDVAQRREYTIDEKNVYAWCSSFEQKPLSEGKWETHDRYGDIHYILEGEQRFGYAARQNLRESEGYDSENDLEFWRGDGDMLTLLPGSFIIVFPEDAHMPDIAPADGARVKKTVVKFLEE